MYIGLIYNTDGQNGMTLLMEAAVHVGRMGGSRIDGHVITHFKGINVIIVRTLIASVTEMYFHTHVPQPCRSKISAGLFLDSMQR